MAKYRILSLDGGGIRGIITAILIDRLQQESGLSGFLDNADLLAGTSTGGLLALGIANGIPLNRIISIYENDGRTIFKDNLIDDILDLGKIVGADYSTRNLKRVLKREFGETKLGKLKKSVLITAFDLDNESSNPKERMWKPKLFHNISGKDNDNTSFVRDIAAYTAAAPTYFPSIDGYIDGGVYANNPSMCALAQTQDPRSTSNPKLDSVVLLSFGTGISLYHIPGKTHDWGFAQWAKPLINLMLDGISGIADYECKQILRERYHRLAPVFPPNQAIPMDAVDRLPELRTFAESSVDITATAKWIRENWI